MPVKKLFDLLGADIDDMPTLLPAAVEWFLRALIVYSVAMYFMEIEYAQTANSREGWLFWLWSERVVASVFTVEYFVRWWVATRDPNWGSKSWWEYPRSIVGVFDLIAIAPFWLGFFVPVSWLGLVRTLRVLRLLKLYRYSRGMRAFIRGLWLSRRLLAGMGVVVVTLVLFCAAAMYQIEGAAQPDKFGVMSNCIWYVIVSLSTVGYGDLAPVTTAGKAFASLMLVVGLGAAASFIGIVGATVLDQLQTAEKRRAASVDSSPARQVGEVVEATASA